MTVAAMMASDILLNPKHVGSIPQVVAKVWKYLGSTLGITPKECGDPPCSNIACVTCRTCHIRTSYTVYMVCSMQRAITMAMAMAMARL